MPTNRFYLNGIDYFQVLINHRSKKNGGHGHEARLSIQLQGKLSKTTLEESFYKNTVLQKLVQLRVNKTFGFGFPYIYYQKASTLLPVEYISLESNEVPNSYFNIPLDVFKNPPFKLHVFYLSNGNTTLLFTFHHILFDFAGVQSFIYSLAGIKQAPLIIPLKRNRTFIQKWKGFFSEVVFTFKEANAKMTIPSAPIPIILPLEIEYHEIVFTKEETSFISSRSINNSIDYISSVSCTLYQHIFSKQTNGKFIWIPVPVNNRRKGETPAILFNCLTFLFYKLYSNDLSDYTTVVKNVKAQMEHQMRNDLPNAFIDFVEGYKYMPMPLYYPMLLLPSWGKLASFSFSSLGSTFSELNTFLNHEVVEIQNFPSNSISPGITFLFYEYKNQLRLMSSWVKGQYSPNVQNKVLEGIRVLLKGE